MSRALALTPTQQDDIWRLWLRRVPQAEIARRIGCSRTTVSNTVVRIRSQLNERRLVELEDLRTDALAEYDTIKEEAWHRLEACKPTSPVAVGYLSTILTARQAQDRILGLEGPLTIEHRGVLLARLDAVLDAPVPLVLPGADPHE